MHETEPKQAHSINPKCIYLNKERCITVIVYFNTE